MYYDRNGSVSKGNAAVFVCIRRTHALTGEHKNVFIFVGKDDMIDGHKFQSYMEAKI